MSTIELEALSVCAKALTRALEQACVPDAVVLADFLSFLGEEGWHITRKYPNGPNAVTGTSMLLPPLVTGLMPDVKGQPPPTADIGIEDPIPS